MATSTLKYNNKSMSINVQSITPSQLNRFLKFPDIGQKMLQDKDGNLHSMENNKFNPELKADTVYHILDDDCFNEKQHDDSQGYENSRRLENNSFTNEYSFVNCQQQQPPMQSDDMQESKKDQSQQNFDKSDKNQFNRFQTVAFQDYSSSFKFSKIFFENITNGCIAIEELVLLSVSVPDVKLNDNRSLRVSICEGIKVFGKSYSEAANAVDEIRLRIIEIPGRIHQGLEAFSVQENSNHHLQNLLNTINSSLMVLEKKANLFENPRFVFIELEQTAKRAQTEQENVINSEQKAKIASENEMKQIEEKIRRKKEEIKSLATIIQSADIEIEAFNKNSAKKKSGFFGSFTGANNTEAENNELKDLQEQRMSAKKNKSQLENEIDDLEMRKIDVKHKIKNAKVEPTTKWEEVMNSIKKIISSVEEIERTWKSLIEIISGVESGISELQNAAAANKMDNSNLINAAVHVCLKSWCVCQCCEIYADIVKSHVSPFAAGVTSNFGLSNVEAKNKLFNEKTKSISTKDKVTKEAETRLSEAIKNLAKVSVETEQNFKNIFSTTV